MQEEIKRFQEQLGTTVIYVTHDQQEAAFLGDRIAIMRDGGLAQVGEARWLYENPNSRFIAEFLGETTVVPILSVSEATAGAVKAKLAENVEVSIRPGSRADSGHLISVRPERVAVGPSAKMLTNAFRAIVSDVAYTLGSVRYMLTLPGTSIAFKARVPTASQAEIFAKGTMVDFGWSEEDVTILVA
jgi:putative spermidine/putrescine transport system ATP-binding protein